MLRNKEFRIQLLVLCLIALVSTGAAAFLSQQAMLLVLLTSFLLIGASILFTSWRYREIQKLSGYLRQISSGNYSLDVRNNYEGELSILRNEIYKMTFRLSEQSSQLLQDKVHLKDAISDISHQLKTPLTSMMMMADLLSDANLPDAKRTAFTRNIHIQLERTEWLVSSLLKLSKIDAGTARFKKEQITVSELIQKALDPVLIPMDIKEQTVALQGDASISFSGDFNWTAEALINLLKNAVEHTPAGGKITISYAENVLYTEIRIEDNGRGIPKEDLPHIFKRFYKGKYSSEGSIGIGLAMAHSIISSQNGDIEVKSQEGKGTEFRIKFYKLVV